MTRRAAPSLRTRGVRANPASRYCIGPESTTFTATTFTTTALNLQLSKPTASQQKHTALLLYSWAPLLLLTAYRMNPTAFEIYSFTTNYNCTCDVYYVLQICMDCNCLLQRPYDNYILATAILQLRTALTTLRIRTVLATYSTCILLLQPTDFYLYCFTASPRSSCNLRRSSCRSCNSTSALTSSSTLCYSRAIERRVLGELHTEPLPSGFDWVRRRWPRDEPYEDILPRPG